MNEYQKGIVMNLNPAGTSWSVYLFPDDSMTGTLDAQPWQFNEDGTVDAGEGLSGWYKALPDTDNAYLCTFSAPNTTVEYSFVLYFMTPNLFVAIKDDSLYRVGKKLQIIDLMIVVDTSSLTHNGNGQGSSNKDPAPCDTAWAFMFTDAEHAIGGNGTAALQIGAGRQHRLRIAGMSMSNQFEDALFFYDIEHLSGDHVLNTKGMKNQRITQLMATPAATQEGNLPPQVTFQDGNFYFSQLGVLGVGSECLAIKFVVYGPPTGSARPILGYFKWTMSITVKAPCSSPS